MPTTACRDPTIGAHLARFTFDPSKQFNVFPPGTGQKFQKFIPAVQFQSEPGVIEQQETINPA